MDVQPIDGAPATPTIALPRELQQNSVAPNPSRTRTRDQCEASSCTRVGEHLISCASCQRWFHHLCLGWRDEARDIEGLQFICGRCSQRQPQNSTPRAVPEPAYRPPWPEFSGGEAEDPETFLRGMETRFHEDQIPTSWWVFRAEQQLQEDARRWWTPYREFAFTWYEFKQRLKGRFDSAARRAQIQAKLFGSMQTPKESAEIFILRKIQLFRRLFPDGDKETFLPTLTEQLLPRIKQMFRACPPQSTEELIRLASAIDADQAEDVTYTQPSRPPKCKHCPGYHLQRDCPSKPGGNAENLFRPTHPSIGATQPDGAAINTPRIQVELGGEVLHALIDSGAGVNLIAERCLPVAFQKLVKGEHTTLRTVKGDTFLTTGNLQTIVTVQKLHLPVTLHITRDMEEDLILGHPWLQSANAVIDYSHRTISFGNTGRVTAAWTSKDALTLDMDRMVPPSIRVVTQHADLYERVQQAQQEDPEVADIREKLLNAQQTPSRTKTQKRFLKKYKDDIDHLWSRPGQKGPWRLWVPLALRKEVLQRYHDTPLEGHPGIKATYTALTQGYHWRAALSDVRKHVQSCLNRACKKGGQRAKSSSLHVHNPQSPPHPHRKKPSPGSDAKCTVPTKDILWTDNIRPQCPHSVSSRGFCAIRGGVDCCAALEHGQNPLETRAPGEERVTT
ncbi:uncharacterized protein LOC124173363 [Ischnura elegans]|uniref:uncharacterized protein LOC124173363 n=1 Tax=Ischnura elegans TaxID=197161 RepID=UPI001ED86E1C|nr:uncharacterized protein LOC124173363 [Ischnura elegans]